MQPIRVVLAEDHELVRAGIRSLLQNQGNIEVVAEAANGSEALRLIGQHRPHIVLLDVKMDGLNGLQAAAQVTARFPDVHVIMLSMYADEEYVLQAMRAGAKGYLLKDASPTELAAAVEAVARGEVYLSRAVSQHVLADYARQLGHAGKAAGRRRPSQPAAGDGSSAPGAILPDPVLTRRQLEILKLIAEGLNTQEIAGRLFISPKTVDTHRGQLMDRLGVRDAAGLVRYAYQSKLVSLDE